MLKVLRLAGDGPFISLTAGELIWGSERAIDPALPSDGANMPGFTVAPENFSVSL
ncbi:MAG TPA: hypothetical protein VFU13_23065 [Steroidobacteraceae bacterium]|nr:hypothetical protein [Steroidobacteraceae bacterium]